VAVFRYDGKVSAISNVCQHQNGPLGEGRIIDGCVTCPWHGYQYKPESGAAPAPFKEKVPTFQVRVVDGTVFIAPHPKVPGTYVEPARVQSMQEPVGCDFYVGYLPNAPAALGGFVRKAVAGLGALGVVIALVLVIGQTRLASSAFEYGKVRDFEGTMETSPYPTLLVSRPGELGPNEAYSRYLLVAPGKHGAEQLVDGFHGKYVRLRGQLIYRDGATMVEVEPGSIILTDSAEVKPETIRDLGPVTVSGEIVDSKCYLGVMNPGEGKVHRDCASRCLSGGIPPLFITSDGRKQFLLVGSDGGAFSRDTLRDFIAEPITIQGELLKRGETRLLRIDARMLQHPGGS